MTRRRGHDGKYDEVLAAVGTEKPGTQSHYTYERMIEMKGEGNFPRPCTARGQVVVWLSELTRLAGPGKGPREEAQSAGAGTAREQVRHVQHCTKMDRQQQLQLHQ